jgi:saccharopine dehydrogenase-like NADP-dependent oxidoreductase
MANNKVLVLGSKGIQGRAVCKLLREFDNDVVEFDVSDEDYLVDVLTQRWDLVFSCMPYHKNVHAAKIALGYNGRWADLGGNIMTSEIIKSQHTQGKVIATNLGLAPGLVEQLAWREIYISGKQPRSLRMLCGGLPQKLENPFGYALSFSVDGIINEYVDTCFALVDGKIRTVEPMGDVQFFIWPNSAKLEGANTSGCLSQSSLEYFKNYGLRECRYQTLRYENHWDLTRSVWKNCEYNRYKFSQWLELTACGDPNVDRIYLGLEIDGNLKAYNILPKGGLTAMQRGTAIPAVAAAILMLKGYFDGPIGYGLVVSANMLADKSYYWELIEDLLPEVK